HRVGRDRFVRFDQEMNWINARVLCQSNGLDLYRPNNITAVSQYLEDNFSDRWYWVGGRGNGTHQLWFSGEVVTRADPWYSNHYTKVGTDFCLQIIAYSGNYAEGTVLASVPCTRSKNI
ncbi:unnamed protein product, partial [Meganyctiphanes norvegica]